METDPLAPAADVRTVRMLVRRLRYAVADLRGVVAEGVDLAVLRAAAAAEGLDVGVPDGFVVWEPRGIADLSRIPAGARAVVVVAASVVGEHPLATDAAGVPAARYSTLREWVGGWPLGAALAPLLRPDAVGARTCRLPMPGNFEWLLAANAAPRHESLLREAIVTLCGIGRFPVMPATLACIVLLPAGLAAHALAGAWFPALAAALALASSALSVALERWSTRHFLAEDPREFVLDEAAGLAAAWAILPAAAPWPWIVAAFALFRLFDIFKPGIRWVENLPIPGKIVWDDLLAGLCAGTLCLAGWLLLC